VHAVGIGGGSVASGHVVGCASCKPADALVITLLVFVYITIFTILYYCWFLCVCYYIVGFCVYYYIYYIVLLLVFMCLFTENETEISYFRLEDYLVYKANPRTMW